MVKPIFDLQKTNTGPRKCGGFKQRSSENAQRQQQGCACSVILFVSSFGSQRSGRCLFSSKISSGTSMISSRIKEVLVPDLGLGDVGLNHGSPVEALLPSLALFLVP